MSDLDQPDLLHATPGREPDRVVARAVGKDFHRPGQFASRSQRNSQVHRDVRGSTWRDANWQIFGRDAGAVRGAADQSHRLWRKVTYRQLFGKQFTRLS